MARRKSSEWRYTGVIGKKKQRRGSANRRTKKRFRGLLALFGIGRSKKKDLPRPLMRRSTLRNSQPEWRRTSYGSGRGSFVHLAGWLIGKVVDRKWRRLSPSEALIWIAASVVSIAFLLLMAKWTIPLAVAIFILLAAFAWRELGEN